jgi:hypothetical protein
MASSIVILTGPANLTLALAAAAPEGARPPSWPKAEDVIPEQANITPHAIRLFTMLWK